MCEGSESFRELYKYVHSQYGARQVTLFRCATMEDWTDVMYISMYGCNKYYYGNDNELHKCENNESYGMVAAGAPQAGGSRVFLTP